MPFVYCASWDLISDLIQLKLTNHIRDLTPAIDWNSEIITSRSTSSFTHRSKLLAHNMAEHLLRQTRGPCIRLDYVNILIHGHPYIRRVRILRENIHYVLFNSAGMHTVSVRFNSINFGWTSLNWMFVNWSLLLLSRDVCYRASAPTGMTRSSHRMDYWSHTKTLWVLMSMSLLSLRVESFITSLTPRRRTHISSRRHLCWW